MTINYRVLNLAGAFQGELRGARLESLDWELNAPGGARIAINPAQATAKLIKINECEIQIWIDDVLRHWVVPRRRRGNSQQRVYQCEGILSWLDWRFIHTTLTYTSIDQFNIAADLISYAQTGTNMDRRIVTGAFSPSGKIRSREYPRDERSNILRLLEEFPTVKNGFDFDLKLYGDGRREFVMFHPRKGSFKPQHTLEWGINIKDYDVDEDGGEHTTRTWALGASDGTIRFENNYEDVTLSARFGVMQKIVSEGSQKDVGWLLDRAQEEVETFGVPIKLPDVLVSSKYDGLIETGDTIPLRIEPEDIAGTYRVTSISRQRNGDLKLGFSEAA